MPDYLKDATAKPSHGVNTELTEQVGAIRVRRYSVVAAR